jgi:glycosyltransferase involved in cell wall biosynthesis
MSTDQPAKVTLGLVAICRNEERDLPGFLQYHVPWVNEIILVDDGSTDRTIELARSAGPKVKIVASPRQPGEGYSSQRNKGIDAATSDWLLHMDIDERVTPELREEILQAISRPDHDAYSYHRLNFFLHRPVRHGNWAFYRSLRLAPRKFKFGRKIHERLVFGDIEPRIGRLKQPMWHYNEPAYEMRLRKSLAYTLLDGEILVEKGRRITVWHLITRPTFAFVKTYILLFGFLDGVTGLILGIHTFASTFDTYVLAWDAQNRIPREKLEADFAKLK